MKRVELNAMRPRDFINWIEKQSSRPTASPRSSPTRRRRQRPTAARTRPQKLQAQIDKLVAEHPRRPSGAVPAISTPRSAQHFENDPTLPWDAVITNIVKKALAK